MIHENATESGPSNSWYLFVTSVTALYAELLLIRWIGTEVRIFAFFQNLGLIACFLGFGLGCYRASERVDLLGALRALTILAAMVSFPLTIWQNLLTGISDSLAMSPDAALWGSGINIFGDERVRGFILSCAILSLFIILLTIVMVPFGQLVAGYMNSARNVIRAYSINLIGSIIGVWLMACVSFLRMPPVVWFALLFVFSMLCRASKKRFIFATIGLMIIASSFLYFGHRTGSQTLWSPYQKLTVINSADRNYSIEVNNSTYMTIGNVTDEYLGAHPDVASNIKGSSYDSPFRFAETKNKVLIVGSGAGNDVAAALRNGSRHVDAVEIDPVIETIGARLHPEHPYQSPRVRVTINDARNFLRTHQQKYDVIVFGLLDSHTGFSSYSNMRIDNYVYTTEAFQSARSLLNPGGILILKFEVREPWTWMGQRFYTMLNRVFGHAPVAYYAPSVGPLLPATVFIESNSPDLWSRATKSDLGSLIATHPIGFSTSAVHSPAETTDDWPYVYHRNRTIPKTYLTVTVILLVLSFLSVRQVFDPSASSTWEFFFLGAGFLLLETQLINRLALYFGSTWIVNCIAITMLLVVLVLANVLVERGWGSSIGPYYILLVGALLAGYAAALSRLSVGPILDGLFLCLEYAVPIFCAGIVFSRSFRIAQSKSKALGANVFGAVAGGLLQNLSFIFGLNALLLVAAGLYCLAGSAAAFLRKDLRTVKIAGV